MKSNSPAASRRPSQKMRGLSLSRTFLAKTRPVELDVTRNPKPGDILRLEGYGGEIVLNDGQIVTLQTLVNISVSGVVVFTYPKTQTPGGNKQTASFKAAHQELTNSGFGVYGLSRDPPPDSDNQERFTLPFKQICDERGTLASALGLDRGGREPIRGVVAIGKDGRVIASTAGGPNATLESVAPLLHTLGVLERTPIQEYTGEEYFMRSPTSPMTPSSGREDTGSYFGNVSPVSPSVASLHSYLQQMDSSAPSSLKGNSTLRRPGWSRTHSWQAQETYQGFLDGNICPSCGAGHNAAGNCECDLGLPKSSSVSKATSN